MQRKYDKSEQSLLDDWHMVTNLAIWDDEIRKNPYNGKLEVRMRVK